MVLAILAMSLAAASATLVSKTLGEGDLTGAADWGWDTGKLGIIGITLLGVPLFLFPENFIHSSSCSALLHYVAPVLTLSSIVHDPECGSPNHGAEGNLGAAGSAQCQPQGGSP